MIEKKRPDLLALSTALYDLSVSCDLLSKAEMSQFGAPGRVKDGNNLKPLGMTHWKDFEYVNEMSTREIF